MATIRTIAIVLCVYIAISLGADYALAAQRHWLGIPTKNHALGISNLVLVVDDYLGTINIEDTPGVEEANKNLGKNPSRGKINRYFLLKTLAVVGINTWRPLRKIKNFFNIWQIGITGYAIKGHIELGVRIGL